MSDRLDPACVDDVYEATIVNQVFDGLLSFDAHLRSQRLAHQQVVDPQPLVLAEGEVAVVPPRPGLGRLLEQPERVPQSQPDEPVERLALRPAAARQHARQRGQRKEDQTRQARK